MHLSTAWQGGEGRPWLSLFFGIFWGHRVGVDRTWIGARWHTRRHSPQVFVNGQGSPPKVSVSNRCAYRTSMASPIVQAAALCHGRPALGRG